MKLTRFLAYSLCAGMLLSTAACGDDEPSAADTEQTGGNGGENGGANSGQSMTVTETKEYIGGVAEEMAGLFRAEDHRATLEFCDYFMATYGDMEFEIDGPDYAPARYVRNLRKALKGDLSALTRAGQVYTYNLKFADYTGIYTAQGNVWRKTSDSDHIEFRFSDQTGQNCVLKVTASSDYSNINFDIEDYDYFWDGSQYVEENWTDEYRIQVPRTVNVALTQGSNTIASSEVKSNINLQNHTFTADVTANVANLSANAHISGNNISANTTVKGYVGGTELVNAEATLNGSRLCDYEYLQSILDDENEEAIANLFSNANATGTILNKIRVSASASMNASLRHVLAADSYWSVYDGYSIQEARNEANTYITHLRNAFNNKVCFNNLNTERASIDYIAKQWGSESEWWDIEVVPVIAFPDGTTYEFEEYFETGFDGVASVFENLVDSYYRLWN